MDPITQNEILDALRAALAPAGALGDGATVVELCKTTRRSSLAVRKALRAMLEAGTAEVVKVLRPRMDLVVTPVTGYKLKGPLA